MEFSGAQADVKAAIDELTDAYQRRELRAFLGVFCG